MRVIAFPTLLRRFYEMAGGKVGIARCRPGAAVSKQLAKQWQIFAGHYGLTGGRVPKVMPAQPAELRICARRPPASCQNPDTPACGVARKQERVWIAGTYVDADYPW